MHSGYISAINKTIQVTPNNDSDLPNGFKSRAISCAVAGTVAYVNEDGVESSINLLVAGIFYPVNCRRIKVTGTTATGIEAHA
jgi:hypothetical protein